MTNDPNDNPRKRKDDTHIEALFLGPKGENADFFKDLLLEALEDHAKWRRSFGHPDVPFVTEDDKADESFKGTQQRIRSSLNFLQERLKMSQPFFSPRYVAHMNWDTLMAASVAYFQTALYNPNNVAFAGSTATTQMEIEVGEDFCKLLGYDPVAGWGHLCSGGTSANMEALWIARNLKYLPCAILDTLFDLEVEVPVDIYLGKGKRKHLLECTTDELSRALLPMEAVDLLDEVRAKMDGRWIKEFEESLEGAILQSRGIRDYDPGVILVPQTKHYSWKKVADLLGLGLSSLRYIPVDEHFRMDSSLLIEILEEEERPVLAVIAVLGTTEESSIDPIDDVLRIREQFRALGLSFYIHIDAAYGGYATALFRDFDGSFLDATKMKDYLEKFGIITPKITGRHQTVWPSPKILEAYKALGETDSITLDPHKLGFVQYPAGGVIYKDRRYRDSIACFAPYVFSKPEPGEPDMLIGAYILEGSKPGAAAAAVWTAHRTLPLNIEGYGRLIGEAIDGAQALYFALHDHCADRTFSCDGDQVFVKPVIEPDLNIVTYAFNYVNNPDLDRMNELNERIAGKCFGPLPKSGSTMLERTFIVSSTDFTHKEYGNSPLGFLERMGIDTSAWGPGAYLKIIRSTVMSPYLTTDFVEENYVVRFLETIEERLAQLED